MLQLVYLSNAAPNVDAQAVARILIQSRSNNRRDGITGLLYHDGKRFMQALEGDEATVQRTFDRIFGDPRHHDVSLLSRRQVDEREFGAWAMASRPFGSLTAQEMTVMVETLASRASRSVRDHFETFARQAA